MNQSAELIHQFWWRPLVQVPVGWIGALATPGTTPPLRRLAPGWYWHWPALTAIRLIWPGPLSYIIDANRPSPHFGDEPIVVVSHDHQLLTLTGQLTIQLDPNVSDQILSQLDGNFVKQRLRPIIRQQLRSVAGQYPKADLKPSAQLITQFQQAIQSELTPFGIEIATIELIRLEFKRLKRA